MMIVKRIKIFGLEEINMPIKFYKEFDFRNRLKLGKG